MVADADCSNSPKAELSTVIVNSGIVSTMGAGVSGLSPIAKGAGVKEIAGVSGLFSNTEGAGVREMAGVSGLFSNTVGVEVREIAGVSGLFSNTVIRV